jgi:hypothetical protein
VRRVVRPFTFLGHTYGPMRARRDGRRYVGAAPAKKAVQRVKGGIRQILCPGNHAPWENVVGGARRGIARLGAPLPVRNALGCVPGGGSLRHGAGAALSAATAQGSLARDEAPFGEGGVWRAGSIHLQRFYLGSPAHARV